jgi:hypothetical protein
MKWNLLHVAWMLKDNGGIPAHGNRRDEWGAMCHPDNANPEHRQERAAPGGYSRWASRKDVSAAVRTSESAGSSPRRPSAAATARVCST